MNDELSLQTQVFSATAPGAVDRAVELLAAGEVVALPTETVYGLAGIATAAPSVARIFEAKERPFSDPLIVHLPSLAWLEEMVLPAHGLDAVLGPLAAEFWPGPLTLVLPRRPGALGDAVTAGSSYVAVRMSAHPVFRAVIEKLDQPLAAPSANRFGRISPTAAAHVLTELGGRIPLIIDGGPTEHGLESTILALAEDGANWRILRHGPVTEEMLAGFGVMTKGKRPDGSAASATRAAPGQMAAHYAPRTPLVIVAREWLDGVVTGSEATRSSGFLGFRRDRPPKAAVFARTEYLSESGDAREAAANLFSALRRLDEGGGDRIFAESVPESGLGRAIMERLLRAAAGSGA